MICLFSFLYFIYIWLLCHSFTLKDIKSSSRSFIKYASLSISSVLVNMFLLLPTIVATAAAKSSNTQTDFSFNSITNPFLNIRSLFIIKSSQYGVPNIYCGLFIVTLVILYFFNVRIAKREKVISLTFILVMYACFQFQFFNLIWHIFKSPLGFPHRFSFLFSFLLIIISLRELNRLDINTLKQDYKKTFIFISSAIFLTAVALYYGSIATGIKRLIISLLIYAIYLVLLRCVLQNRMKWIAKILTVFVLAFELISTGVIANEEENSHFKTQEFVNYLKENQPVFQYIKNKDSGFYRTEKNYKRLGMEASLNDSLLFNYYGISHYSSSLGMDTRQSIGKLGYTSFDTIWPSWINYNNGSTIAADTLMGLKYIISEQNHSSNGNLLYYNYIHSIDDKAIYKNPYFVGIGFLSQSQLNSSSSSRDNNTFDYQNTLWKSFGSKANIFSPINIKTKLYNTRIVNNHLTKIDNAKESYLEITYKTSGNPEYLYFENQNEFIQSNTNFRLDLNNRQIATYPIITNNGIIPLSTTTKKHKIQKLKLVMNSSDNAIPKMELYQQNNSVFNSIIKHLKQNSFHITKHSNTQISGTISSNDKNSFLFLSIPYDKDWNITVNNHRVTPRKASGSFMTIPLDRGLNRVQVVYRNHDLLIGSIISIISVICLLLIWLYSSLLTRKRSI